MSTTAFDEVMGVRDFLGNPLSQTPSFKDVLKELEVETQHMINDTNNTGNAWQVAECSLNATEGTRRYRICASDFFKPLSVTTVPSNDESTPQYSLEFTEFEHIPKEWAWLSANKGQLWYSSHGAQLVAFYRKLGDHGIENYCEIRPAPTKDETYTILYQVTDWWIDPNEIRTQDKKIGLDTVKMPHSSQRNYIRALVAMNLIMQGKVQWVFDDAMNIELGKIVIEGLKARIDRYKPVYDEYKDSLDNPDVTYVGSWADDNVFL